MQQNSLLSQIIVLYHLFSAVADLEKSRREYLSNVP
jgi:hypothetical protein